MLGSRPRHGQHGSFRVPARHGLSSEPVRLAQNDRDQRHAEVGAGDEHAAAMPHQGGALDLRPDHHAGGVAEHDHRQVEAVAQLHEPGGLVRTIAVNRAGQELRVVGENSDGPALDPGQGGDHAEAEVRPQLQHRARIRQDPDQFADAVDSQAVLRDDPAQESLVLAGPIREGALEIAQVPLGYRDRFRLVLDRQVNDPVGHLDLHRPDLFRTKHPQAAALDQGRPAHPNAGVRGRDDRITAAE